jgi:hypothetical protein
MDSTVKEIVAKVKKALDADPTSIVAGEMRNGLPEASCGVAEWDLFLSSVNGGRFGAFDIWSVEELDMNQVFASVMPGGQHEWLVIGQMIYDPIGLNRTSGEVVCFAEGREPIALGSVETFATDYLLGKAYSTVIPNSQQDEWWKVLREAQVVED